MRLPYFYSVFRQVWHELQYWGNKTYHRFMQTPLPKLLLLAVAILMLFVLLPLTVLLLVTFVLLKIALTLLILAVRRNRRQPPQLK